MAGGPVRRLIDVLGWIGRHELGLLISLVLITGGVWAFVELADEVVEGETHSFDRTVLLAVFLTLLVGVSRVYMGVHWPTDVLAGWTAGAVWALACWLLARQLQRRGRIEATVEKS
jgi:undecaprenyl-diphosphatase